MNRKLLVVKETRARESRVALVPKDIKKLLEYSNKIKLFVESGAGIRAGFSDQDYIKAGAEIRTLENNNFEQLFHGIDFIVRAKRPSRAREILENKALTKDMVMVGALDPLEKNAEHMQEYQQSGIQIFSLDQAKLSYSDPMNLLSAMSNMAGKLALIDALEKYSALDINHNNPAKSVVIIGLGVVGQAALREALEHKLTPVVMLSNLKQAEQLKQQGIKVVIIDRASDLSGQQALVAKVVKCADLVITSARKAGELAPLFITEKILAEMKPGTVVVDMALSEGGNVAGAEHDQTHVLGNHITVTNISGYPKAYPREASVLWSQATCLFLLKYLDNPESIKKFYLNPADIA